MLCTNSSVSPAELKLESKPHANKIIISPNLTKRYANDLKFNIQCYSTMRAQNINLQIVLLCLVTQTVCGRNEPPIKSSPRGNQNKPKFNIHCDPITKTQNVKFQLIQSSFAYASHSQQCFASRIETRIKTSRKQDHNKSKFDQTICK